MLDLFGNSTDISIDNNASGNFTLALDSKFCLCPPGYFNWTARPTEALYHGCIPVIIGKQTLPFSDLLNWKDFSVFIAPENLTTLPQLLEEIDTKQVHQLQKNGSKILKHIFFDQTIQDDFAAYNRGILFTILKILLPLKFW